MGLTGQNNSGTGGGAGWLSQTFDLAEDDVRTLNTAHGGLGFKLFSGAGAKKLILIQNVVLNIDGEFDFGGIGDRTFKLIMGDTGNIIFSAIGGGGSFDIDNIPITFQPGTDTMYTYRFDDAIYFNYGADTPDFVGTGKLTLDYKILDFS